MHGEARGNLSSALSRETSLDLTRDRHPRSLHDIEGIERTAAAHVDRARVERKTMLEWRAFNRQEWIVRRFHAKVAEQRARLATRKEENVAVVRFRIAYMADRRSRLLTAKAPPRRPSGPVAAPVGSRPAPGLIRY